MWVLGAHTRRPGLCVGLAFSPGKEQAAGVWETCLAPGWPGLPEGEIRSPPEGAEIPGAGPEKTGGRPARSLPEAVASLVRGEEFH